MARMLTSDEINAAWSASATAREEMLNNRAYFDGDQPILDKRKNQKRKNGLDYHRLVPNVFRVIARRHKGFLFGRPMNVTLGQGGSEDALAAYEQVRRANTLDRLDADHYLESLLSGFSVEVHSFDPNLGPVVTQTPAAEWAFVKDEFERVVYAIRKITLPRATFFNGAILEKPLDLWTVYTDAVLQVFTDGSIGQPNAQKSGEDVLNEIAEVGVVEEPATAAAVSEGYTGAPADSGGTSDLLPYGPPIPHRYGRVPVFQWTGEENFKPFFTEDFRSLQDAYNETLSMLLDDFEGDIEALLLILGLRQGELSKEQTDEEGVGTGLTLIQEIKETGGISMGSDADARFITRELSVDKPKFTMSELRQLLYELGHAPDLSRVVGVTGQTTGIALKLQFQTMIEKSADSTHFIRKSISERVDLLNRVWRVRNLSLAGYNLEFTMLIPVNEIERWENIQFLMPLLSAVDLLRLIQSVDDPEEAWARKKKEIAEGFVLAPVQNKPEEEGETANGTANGGSTSGNSD
jgi:hypothetical protein